MSIRDAKLSDEKAIESLSEAFGYSNFLEDFSLEKMAMIINSDDQYLKVYDDGVEVRGWVHYIYATRIASPSFFEIVGLVTSPNFRRKGVGTKLVESAANHSKKVGVKVRVRCSSNRKDSHFFYNSAGLSIIKEQLVFEK